MHDCPRCGQACYCHGDIDDTYVLTEAWVFQNCDHVCDKDEDDYDYDWDGLDPINKAIWDLYHHEAPSPVRPTDTNVNSGGMGE